jgi:hypothetical protein
MKPLLSIGTHESIHDDGEASGYFVDDNTGIKLSDKLVNEGRMLEMKTFREMGVYEYVLKSEAVKSVNGKLVGVRWVDSLKGDIVRSRLVAQEFAGKDDRDDLFAATPPLSATKFVISEVASKSNRGSNEWKLMVLDVKRAFLYGNIQEEIYVHLPAEDPMHGLGYVGRLVKAMYGTRAAPQVWQEVVRQNMTAIGFDVNPIFPCVYYHPGKDMTVVTHVDDFLCSGQKHELLWFKEMLSVQFEMKAEILGGRSDESKEINFLGRTIRQTADGIEMEGDPKHVKILLDEWDMSSSKTVSSPGADIEKANIREKQDEERGLEDKEATIYRRAAARLNYMSLDRADLSYASKECSRGMAKPTVGDIVRLKRVLRYLKGSPRIVNTFKWQEPDSRLRTYSDSDWAGCAKTRRSTSGGMILRGAHLLAHWSTTQSTVALSSAEAELNALIKAASETLGVMNMLKAMGKDFKVEIFTDSSAANGIVHRLGCGKVKHLEARQLWLQEVVRMKTLQVKKVGRELNISDAMTHHWSCVDGTRHFTKAGIEWRQ